MFTDDARLLHQVEDPGAWDAWARWYDALERRAWELTESAAEGPLVSLEGAALALDTLPGERFRDERFRRFLGAVLAADWLTYASPDERVAFGQLCFTLDRFPSGFRVWFARLEGSVVPVGYSAWHPIDAATWRRFETHDPPWHDRALVSLTRAQEGDYLYLFNYSVLAPWRRGEGSRALLRGLAQDVAKVSPRGMVAITVSDDGSRVARRFGLARRGEITVGASREEVWMTP